MMLKKLLTRLSLKCKGIRTHNMTRVFKSPLSIYVVWHPNFKEGDIYADLIYKSFCRDSSIPLARGLGIPVFFRNYTDEEKHILEIPVSNSDKNCIFALIDDNLFNDPIWVNYLKGLVNLCNNDTRIFPLSFSQYSYYIDEINLGKLQFIKLEHINSSNDDLRIKERWQAMHTRLLHDCIRLMYNFPSVADSDSTHGVPSPAKLFISHAKCDGANIALDFRDYLRSETKLSSFFDVNDIADGYNFEKQIIECAANSALVIFQTDEYSDREWCRIEVISAKRHLSPLLVVNCIKKGEKRSFPYMGNCPTIRFNDNNFAEIINLILTQILHNEYQKKLMPKYLQLYDIQEHEVITLASPPELFNFIDIYNMAEKSPDKNIMVLYPEPPLGLEELSLLNEFDERIAFCTPITLPLHEKEIS